MIVGAFAGFVIGIAMYRQSMGAEPFVRSAQMIGYVIAGAAIGLCVELFMRRDESTKREFLLTALVFGLVAIFWALIR